MKQSSGCEHSAQSDCSDLDPRAAPPEQAVSVVAIVTRPATAGERLVARLSGMGRNAVWWPAFDIGPAPDAEAARKSLAGLAHYDLAIFVSASAVRAVQELVDAPWPSDTVIGAVGAATRAAIDMELSPGAFTTVVAPDDESESGSEAFWRLWRQGGRHARRVLILRAEEGRSWLGERFAESGAQVDNLAVYSRRPRGISQAQQTQAQEWAAFSPFRASTAKALSRPVLLPKIPRRQRHAPQASCPVVAAAATVAPTRRQQCRRLLAAPRDIVAGLSPGRAAPRTIGLKKSPICWTRATRTSIGSRWSATT